VGPRSDAQSFGIEIRGENSIFANGGLGIDLGGDGVTANDPGDGDAGPNFLQNVPILTLVDTGSGTAVSGVLSTFPPSGPADSTFTIDLFVNSACDASGNGEGGSLFASTTVTTDAGGNATLGSFPVTLPAGAGVSATATSDFYRSTSEFSPCAITCQNGTINAGEECGEPGLPACASGRLCVECRCRERGDCNVDGAGVNLFDVLTQIDLVLGRIRPTPTQAVVCDDDCSADINLFDVLTGIDVVLGARTLPLLCPAP
jgi:hypothetical protein